MHVSYAELARVAPDVLRMLGSRYGQADDAVECLIWTQAALGRGYALVQATDALQHRADLVPEIEPDPAGYRLRMDRLPLLLYAARIADFAIAEATEPGVRVIAENAVGGWTAPYIAARLARAGLDAVIGWRPSPGSVVHEPSAAVITAFAGGGTPVAHVAAARPWSTGPLLPPGADHRDDRRMLHRFDGAHDPFVMLALPPREPRREAGAAWRLAEGLRLSPSRLERVDFCDRLTQMIRCGCDVDPADHAAWLSIGARIRLPTSDRSRAQAG